MTDAQAYPLQWPAHVPRAKRRERARFETSFARARDGLARELERMGARYTVLSTNVELRLDGQPYANRAEPADPGVAVYFMRNGKRLTFACDRWDRVRDNVQAVRKTIEALRGIERWGASDMLERAFDGFKALPPGSGDGAVVTGARPWRDVLGVGSDCQDFDTVRKAWRRKAHETHPDHGGDPAHFAEVQAAYTQAREAFGHERA